MSPKKSLGRNQIRNGKDYEQNNEKVKTSDRDQEKAILDVGVRQ